MININELLIGSVVETHEGIHRVSGIQEVDSNNSVILFDTAHSCDARICFPTAITTEWLEKLGFEQGYKKTYTKTSSGGIDVDLEPSKYGFQPVVMSPDDFVEVGKNIQYVHELQLLYFSRTGEQLPVSV